MASTLADNSSRTLPAIDRKREQEIRRFASKRRYDCKRLQLKDGWQYIDSLCTCPAGLKIVGIRELARLGVDEINAIEAIANLMAQNLEAGLPALSYNLEKNRLLGSKLSLEPMGFNDTCLDVSAIRACYFPDSGKIALKGKTWYTGQTPNTATLNSFRTWVVAMLAHEACHLIQHREEPTRFGPGSEAAAAAALSHKAKATRLPADYVAYVTCPLEAEAHATQLAAELRPAGQQNYDAFVIAAKASNLVAHIKKKSTSSTGAPWPAWEALETKLIDEAWAASEKMRSP